MICYVSMVFLQKVSFCNFIRNNPSLFSAWRRKKIVIAVASSICLTNWFISHTCYVRNNSSPICSFHTFCNCFCECGGSCGNCEYGLSSLGILYIYPFFAQAEHHPLPLTTPVVKILQFPHPLFSLVYWAHVIQICFFAFCLLG